MSLRKPRPEYFRVKEKFIAVRGNKYFCHYENSDKVVQICFSHGNAKTGRTNTFGMYTIGIDSFLNTYNQGRMLDYCTRQQFKEATKLMVKQLKKIS